MKTWIRRSLVGLFGASVALGGLTACGHRYHGPEAGTASEAEVTKWRERALDKAERELQLDPAQKAKLATLFDTLRTQRKTLAGEGGGPRAELQALVAGERFDRTRAQVLVDSKTQALREGSPQVIAAAADFFDSLKPEQQQKLREFMARGRHHRFGWRG